MLTLRSLFMRLKYESLHVPTYAYHSEAIFIMTRRTLIAQYSVYLSRNSKRIRRVICNDMGYFNISR